MKNILITLIALLLVACAPGLKNAISISAYPVPPSSLEDAHAQGKVHVKTVLDDRASPAVCTISGRSIVGETDPTITVRMAAEQYLKARGYLVTQFKSPTNIILHIKKWNVTVTPKFPMNEINAEATISTEVFNGERKKLSGSYSGLASAKDPFGGQRIIEETLGKALGEALVALAKDAKLEELALSH
jgi:uncharacterized lipoprotein YajG